jgi:hypothetical protein
MKTCCVMKYRTRGVDSLLEESGHRVDITWLISIYTLLYVHASGLVRVVLTLGRMMYETAAKIIIPGFPKLVVILSSSFAASSFTEASNIPETELPKQTSRRNRSRLHFFHRSIKYSRNKITKNKPADLPRRNRIQSWDLPCENDRNKKQNYST